jgi:carbamoyl-phosphate synthase small subunit
MAYLTLEDGKTFEGQLFGIKSDVIGEVVFNTSMTGYQEVLTDPSYCGQIVTMTYPLIGNYGVNDIDPESGKPQVGGFIVRELCMEPNNFFSEMGLDEYLVKNNISGISGIDTRELTRIVREEGVMRGILSENKPSDDVVKKMKVYECKNPVDMVTCDKSYEYESKNNSNRLNIAVMDFGLKRNILRSLDKRGCKLTVFPANINPKEILNGRFDGVMLTNGPGDPQDNVEIIENIKKLLGNLPMFGICLGHQLIALAHGASSSKLKYGHRGANHPVKDLKKDRVYITSQNHGYTINNDNLPKSMEVTHLNWNDQTIEGIKYLDKQVFSVQFHPEAAPGPEDNAYLFDEFIDLMEGK